MMMAIHQKANLRIYNKGYLMLNQIHSCSPFQHCTIQPGTCTIINLNIKTLLRKQNFMWPEIMLSAFNAASQVWYSASACMTKSDMWVFSWYLVSSHMNENIGANKNVCMFCNHCEIIKVFLKMFFMQFIHNREIISPEVFITKLNNNTSCCT